MPEVNYAGLKLRNPVIVSSATPAITVNAIRKAAQAGAGAVVTKSVIFPEKDGRPAGGYPRPRFQLYNCQKGYDASITERGGLFSLFRLGEPYPTPEKMQRMLDEIRKTPGIDIPVIVSICGAPDDYDSWRRLARMMEDAGADALELNMHAYPEIRYTDPLFVRAVREEVKLPVICKLMAINDDPGVAGRQVELAGADAIAALGTFGFRAVEIDVESQKPWMRKAHGLGGSWLRPVSLAYIETLARNVGVPLSGVTGVQTWQDAVKYILLGATTVQICAAVYARGYKVIGEIAAGIDAYMAKKGYKTLDDFRGLSLRHFEEQEYAPPVRARVDPQRCVGCKKCVEICLFDAIEMEGNRAKILDRCDGCGLCWSFCPAGAIEEERFGSVGRQEKCGNRGKTRRISMVNGDCLPSGKKVIMEFERGGQFELELNPDAPKTCEAFIRMLSYTGEALHARFSGTEFFFVMPLGAPSENIRIPKRGNVAFNSNHEQAVCVYYDDSIHASDPPFNYFADLRGDMEELAGIGVRIWRQGMEKVTVRLEDR